MMDWYFATWYWPTECWCWHAQYDLRSWYLGGNVGHSEFIVRVGPFSFGWSSFL